MIKGETWGAIPTSGRDAAADEPERRRNMRGRVKAVIADTGESFQWELKNTSFEKCQQFVEAAIENEPRITNFTIELFYIVPR